MGDNIDGKLNWSRIITMIGAILAFSIGSGYATGQEVVQFITAYGYQGLLVGLIFILIFGYSNYAYAKAGYIGKFDNGSDVYRYFCGKTIGTAYDLFSVLFCYMSFIVMIGGASATLQQQYNVPLAVGGFIITVLACITVIFGLNSLVNVIGKIGPVIVVICMAIGLYTLIVDGAQIPEGVRLVNSGEVQVMKASTHWLLAGGSYAGFCMLWFGGFMAKLGSNNDPKELNIAVVIAAVLNTLAIVISGYALMANVSLIADAQIPNIVLVKKLIPVFAPIFSLVVFSAIYTTSVPLLWTAVSRFAEEKSKRFYILTMILAALGYLVAMKIPFNRLLNIVYVINGYAGIVLLGFIIVKNVRLRMASK
jgi:uncharacterized membrane protein YkvI